MSSAGPIDARTAAQLLARCVFLLRLTIDLAQRAHAAGTGYVVRSETHVLHLFTASNSAVRRAT